MVGTSRRSRQTLKHRNQRNRHSSTKYPRKIGGRRHGTRANQLYRRTKRHHPTIDPAATSLRRRGPSLQRRNHAIQIDHGTPRSIGRQRRRASLFHQTRQRHEAHQARMGNGPHGRKGPARPIARRRNGPFCRLALRANRGNVPCHRVGVVGPAGVLARYQ